MGLTKSSTGKNARDSFKKDFSGITVAFAGNPNVGKSTLFNHITGMHQHTGNWPGKTVAGAVGKCTYKNHEITLVDLPGCYSLLPHSPEEEITRDFIASGDADLTVVICDATSLERNLILVLQTLDVTNKVILCVNLMDEAEKKGIKISKKELEKALGIPVVMTAARSGKGTRELLGEILKMNSKERCVNKIQKIPETEEEIIKTVERAAEIAGRVVRFQTKITLNVTEKSTESYAGIGAFPL